MGSAFSDEEASPPFPIAGKAVVVKVQCSHNGKCVCFREHRGHRVTSEWTAAHLHEAVEVLAGVHRQCQRLMFGGRILENDMSLLDVLGCVPDAVPDRIKLFLIVDKHRFPQRLGPFNTVPVPLEAKDFDMPEMTEEFRRCGFYWDMPVKVLEGHGLQARTHRITGQVSPTHPVTVDSPQKPPMTALKESRDFVWSYPVAGWEGVESNAYALDRWEEGLEGGAAIKSFFSVGGYMYFDVEGHVAGVATLGRVQDGDSGSLHFAEPRRWLPEWTAALVEQGRFQSVTMKAFVEVGARMYLWLRPNEVIEAVDGNPLPQQPEVPHGAFVYLFHEDVLDLDEVSLALDRYFAVVPTPVAVHEDCASFALFRPFTLVDGEPFPGTFGGGHGHGLETTCEAGSDSDSENWETQSFMMSTPAKTSMETPASVSAMGSCTSLPSTPAPGLALLGTPPRLPLGSPGEGL